jgi:hypothetical protein
MLPQRTTSQYSDQIRQQAMAEYAISGNATIVSKSLNLPRRTVTDWTTSQWGQELIATIRLENQDMMIASYTNIIKGNLSAQLDRIENGDVVGTDDNGNELRQAVRYRDLVVGAGIAVDKMRLLSNQATSITVTDSALTKISEQLQQFTRHKQEKDITPST